MTLATERPEHLSAQNVLEGSIERITDLDGPTAEVLVDCHGDCLSALVTRRAVEMLSLGSGQRIYAIVKSVTFDLAAV